MNEDPRECKCAGCKKLTRKSKFASVREGYCQECFEKGHNFVFIPSYTDPIRDDDGTLISGYEPLPLTEKQIEEGRKFQRKLHRRSIPSRKEKPPKSARVKWGVRKKRKGGILERIWKRLKWHGN